MEEKIRAKLEEVRSMLQADGGDLEVAEIEDTNVKLRLTGACGGCPHATITIKQGIERILKEQVDDAITVERVE
ncbi:MAG: NifU family protein [Kiritimatiellia bacterium]|jgi:Fe-S cluster biogenesis protein NfuA|nr:NifU family protein [Kiritimatiellia bacterium]MDP6848092.1 NifU family protein [Kiritimatiellia bacterium]